MKSPEHGKLQEHPSGEQPEEKVFSAERLAEVRKFAEAAYSTGLSPRDVIKDKIKETGVGAEYQRLPKGFKALEKMLYLGFPEKSIFSLKYLYTYNEEMARKLIEAGAIKPNDDKHEVAANAFLRAQRDPNFILDQEKFKEVLKRAEEEFFAANSGDVNLVELTEKLKKVRKAQAEELEAA